MCFFLQPFTGNRVNGESSRHFMDALAYTNNGNNPLLPGSNCEKIRYNHHNPSFHHPYSSMIGPHHNLPPGMLDPHLAMPYRNNNHPDIFYHLYDNILPPMHRNLR